MKLEFEIVGSRGNWKIIVTAESKYYFETGMWSSKAEVLRLLKILKNQNWKILNEELIYE